MFPFFLSGASFQEISDPVVGTFECSVVIPIQFPIADKVPPVIGIVLDHTGIFPVSASGM